MVRVRCRAGRWRALARGAGRAVGVAASCGHCRASGASAWYGAHGRVTVGRWLRAGRCAMKRNSSSCLELEGLEAGSDGGTTAGGMADGALRTRPPCLCACACPCLRGSSCARGHSRCARQFAALSPPPAPSSVRNREHTPAQRREGPELLGTASADAILCCVTCRRR